MKLVLIFNISKRKCCSSTCNQDNNYLLDILHSSFIFNLGNSVCILYLTANVCFDQLHFKYLIATCANGCQYWIAQNIEQ